MYLPIAAAATALRAVGIGFAAAHVCGSCARATVATRIAAASTQRRLRIGSKHFICTTCAGIAHVSSDSNPLQRVMQGMFHISSLLCTQLYLDDCLLARANGNRRVDTRAEHVVSERKASAS